MKLGQGSQHEQELRQAAGAAPQSVAVRQTLAHVLVQDGRLDDAAGVLEEARKLSPRNAPVLSALEAIYRKAGRDDALAAILRHTDRAVGGRLRRLPGPGRPARPKRPHGRGREGAGRPRDLGKPAQREVSAACADLCTLWSAQARAASVQEGDRFRRRRQRGATGVLRFLPGTQGVCRRGDRPGHGIVRRFLAGCGRLRAAFGSPAPARPQRSGAGRSGARAGPPRQAARWTR